MATATQTSNDWGTHGRASLDVTGLYCAPCKRRGHECYAQTRIDDEPWCIFCADDEPCVHDQRAAKLKQFSLAPQQQTPETAKTAAAAVPLDIPHTTKSPLAERSGGLLPQRRAHRGRVKYEPAAAGVAHAQAEPADGDEATAVSTTQLRADQSIVRKLHADGLSVRDMCAALRKLGYKAGDIAKALRAENLLPVAPRRIERKRQSKGRPAPTCKCGCGQPVDGRYGKNGDGPWRTYRTGHFKKNGPAKSTAKRTCKCGCGGRVSPEARFSYLPGHIRRKVEKVPDPPAPPPKRPTIVYELPQPIDESPRVALEVTEQQLNGFLVNLPLESKLTLAQQYLRSTL